MSRDPSVVLADVLECAGRIADYVSGLGFEEFSLNTMAQDAVLRNLEVIGEAVKRVPDEWRGRAPDVPWRDIAGLRDHLIHEYPRVDLAIVWDVVVNEVPSLAEAIEALLEKDAEDE
ncbi:MAG: DUF86 domain-containing protein [Thermoleophilia bacterium]|nr:DUF86 domain-containing protein [Thermoleophilia bacterium]